MQISLRTEDGVCRAQVAGNASAPGVLLFMDGIGMRPAIVELAERIAAAGYHVLAPDLFYRLGDYIPPDPRALFADPAVRTAWFDRVRPLMAADMLTRDIGAYLAFFPAGQKIGVTGYCMGGRLAILAAATHPERIAAAAAFHPGGLVTATPESPHRQVGSIKAEIYVAGAMEDQSFTAADRVALDEALTAAGVKHVVVMEQARHGWVPTDTAAHDPAAAARHDESLLALFARCLRP
jgi:carboxymethylenebutenolidase